MGIRSLRMMRVGCGEGGEAVGVAGRVLAAEGEGGGIVWGLEMMSDARFRLTALSCCGRCWGRPRDIEEEPGE